MIASHLRLNQDSGHVAGFQAQVDRITVDGVLLSSATERVTSALLGRTMTSKCRSLLTDHDLSLTISALSPVACYQLRRLRSFVRSLTVETAKTLVQAFVTCCLDYCNSLLWHYRHSVPVHAVGAESLVT